MSQPPRKSDSFVEGWQKTIRFLSEATDGSPVDELLKDHIRARENETTQAEKIAELEAELARLRPSGQVAEDVAFLEECIGVSSSHWSRPRTVRARATISRLGAQAQGYEAIRVALADNYGTDGDPLKRVRDLLKSEEEASSEARIEQDERHRVELERDRESTRAERAEEERDAAVADCQALLARLHLFVVGDHAAIKTRSPEIIISVRMTAEAMAVLADFLAQPHPGAALLEEMKTLRQRVDDGEALIQRWQDALGLDGSGYDAAEALLEQHRKEVEALTARIAAMREHAQMLYESAPPTNSRTSCEHVEQWEKAKRIHHEVIVQQDADALLLTELNDHRRNIEVLRDELGAKDDEHVVDALHRWQERLAKVQVTLKKTAEYIRTRAGHEENCRGWRRPVKDKSAPSWKRRGEWMDLTACTCGPGELLRLAGESAT